MRAAVCFPMTLLATIFLAGLAISPLPAAAQNLSTDLTPSATGAEETKLRLHPTFERCGKRWLKQLRKLSEEQQRWLLQKHHEVYRVVIGGRTSVRFEMLSTGSFRQCSLRDHWQQRATSIFATFFLPDGSEKRVMTYLGDEEAFFNEQPTFYPSLGKVLLHGVDRRGESYSRWLEMELLRQFHGRPLLARANP